jgi:hypothetical protein
MPTPHHFDVTSEMINHVEQVSLRIFALEGLSGGRLYAERRVKAEFIHPEMFGTCDAIIVSKKRLYIIDFKYGQTAVDPVKNTQLIQYALSVAEKFNWRFETVHLLIMQPRINWFKEWVITGYELKADYLPLWHKGVLRVLKNDKPPFPGSWCHWCRAKQTCPAKNEMKMKALSEVFSDNPLTKEETNGVTEESGRSEDKKREKKTKGREDIKTKTAKASEQAGQESPRQKSKGRKREKETFETETFDEWCG